MNRFLDCARNDKGCARNDKGCARNDKGCARNDKDCARNDKDCARNDKDCARNDKGCARNDKDCARNDKGCARNDKGCARNEKLGFVRVPKSACPASVKSFAGEKQVETKPCELYHRTPKKTLPTQLTESRAMEQKEQRHNWNISFSSMAIPGSSAEATTSIWERPSNAKAFERVLRLWLSSGREDRSQGRKRNSEVVKW